MANPTVLPVARIVPIMVRSTGATPSAGRNIDAAERRLKARLQKLNCYAAETRGDGNCLFYSLSDQLYGTPKRHDEVRRRLVTHIREHRDAFIHFIDVGPDRARSTRGASRQASRSFSGVGSMPSTDKVRAKFDDMLSRMGQLQEWGGALELQAFCQAYVRDVVVYQADNVQEFTSNLHDVDSGRKTVHIAFHEYQHYSSVRSLDGPREGHPCLPRRLEERAAGSLEVKEVKQEKEDSKAVNVKWQPVAPQTKAYTSIEGHGDTDSAFARLLDGDNSSPSKSSGMPTTDDSENSSTLGASSTGLNPATRALGSSSRSSSRHSTGSKRAADPSDSEDEDPIRPAVRRRRPGRDYKRRILPDVTVGLSVSSGQDIDDVISIRLRVDSEAAIEPPQRRPLTPPEDDDGSDEENSPEATRETSATLAGTSSDDDASSDDGASSDGYEPTDSESE
ncbi:hypothetical protein LOZ12_003573 [Ophidiomyces ophidiicola]|uniref:Uncharacterized protein n=1 Tax=Ophidiomyces ophidiicola TaxID=1387563 RepID=A0ACB8UWD0_9EURO|nr:uncharacterized protein LOZ57_002939 [Ophidiomyces ophidiicola]KAI1911065.1 hypothetical protein LOZ61_004043 [Ophidiomyces ophidiicola]KAI1914422.1 hypothetical protein LOZ64_003837 [Ophidiomyces ophidiicola]KAI1931256.1 hypothetical protein LOZ60_000285 [Ophidiomyces ophidiicola]KAI1947788.1 hypothetical protein LOZ57_002939 [Ophidiomyces ophidiicola]KAI1948818.1 hypothetical protein LOZ62_002498 [Ophidiomyces ophidiicola]